MPELPEVETVRRGLEPAIVNQRITRVEQRRAGLRFAFPDRFAERLTGATIAGLARRAKYLLAPLDTGETLILHLGMTGSFRTERNGAETQVPAADMLVSPMGKDARHDHVVLHFADGGRLTYNDPRRFGFMLLAASGGLDGHPLLKGLGVEPTGNELGGALLGQALAGKRTSLKAALLDQRIIAGLGNIYVCEALHRARLSPKRGAWTLARKDGSAGARAERLAGAIRQVIAEAIAAGGSSLKDYVHTDGSLGYFQHSFAVYGREGAPCPAPSCTDTVRRIVQQGRSTFYCPSCQH